MQVTTYEGESEGLPSRASKEKNQERRGRLKLPRYLIHASSQVESAAGVRMGYNWGSVRCEAYEYD